MKKVTIADVATYAGVSKSTVSQFMNKRFEYMSVETRKKVEQAIETLNYRPNLMARSLKQKTSFTIGVVVANIIHSFSTKIINALEASFDNKGFHMIVCNSADNPQKERQHIETLLEKQVDGLIVFPTGLNTDLYSSLSKQKVPMVFIDRFLENVDIPCVLLDNFSTIDLAIKSLGSGPYAIVTTSLELPITPRVERLEGFRQALANRKLPIDENYIQHAEPKDMEGVFKTLLALPNPPKGIIAANDRVSQELMRFINRENIAVPEDLKIIIIDEVPYAEFMTPSLTTLEQPAKEMAEKAASLLLHEIHNEDFTVENKLFRFQPTLIIRKSTS